MAILKFDTKYLRDGSKVILGESVSSNRYIVKIINDEFKEEKKFRFLFMAESYFDSLK